MICSFCLSFPYHLQSTSQNERVIAHAVIIEANTVHVFNFLQAPVGHATIERRGA